MDILITGSIAFDYLMTFPGHFKDHILPDKLDSISLSFLVEKMVVLKGGTAPNIAYTLALLGERSRLMAAVGEDFSDYRAWLEGLYIDTTAVRVIEGEFTASFFANTDRSNNQIASFYPGAMGHAGQLSLHDLDTRPDLVLISPNDPSAMARYTDECTELGIPYFYDPSQQIVRLDADVLRRGIEGAQALFVNDYEFSLVQKATGMSQENILAHVDFLSVTCGEKGADIYTPDGAVHIPIYPPVKIVDPTGVGDAFRAGFLVGFGRGWELELCGRMGSLAATYCLESNGPQGHKYSPLEFINRFRQQFNDAGKLDALIQK